MKFFIKLLLTNLVQNANSMLMKLEHCDASSGTGCEQVFQANPASTFTTIAAEREYWTADFKADFRGDHDSTITKVRVLNSRSDNANNLSNVVIEDD